MAINKHQKIGIFLVIAILLALLIFHQYRKSNIKKYEHKTIALVNGYLRGTKSGPILKYIYRIGENIYDGSTYIRSDEYSKYKNRYFIVSYSSKNPGWSEILLDRPVLDTIKIKEAGFKLTNE
ncbi:hypothetical protein [Costertonia aggregata]|uniref:Uncharacterized protein n=1 Tax=Costertonia aggregata TaxID=343403 RepID=A0A7H9ATR2_9FLAO|nr:hypothetical protein [Costertonia aggregata]QLG46858.1 hypothetical protein HYG79_16360 [Costertonia aggregata]